MSVRRMSPVRAARTEGAEERRIVMVAVVSSWGSGRHKALDIPCGFGDVDT